MARDEGGDGVGGRRCPGAPRRPGAATAGVARRWGRGECVPGSPDGSGEPHAAAAQGPGGHPRLGGALRLSAERARDRRRGGPDVHLVGAPPATHAGTQGLPRRDPHRTRGRRARPGRPGRKRGRRCGWCGRRRRERRLVRSRSAPPGAPSCHRSAISPLVARSSPSRRCRSVPAAPRSSARGNCSCSTSAATRWSMRRSATATGWWRPAAGRGERRDRGRDDRRRGHGEDAAPPRRPCG